MIHYELVIGDGEEGDEDGWCESEYATVIRHEENGTKTEVGWIGGEPEDNTHYRTYSWVVGALNDAFLLGFRMGRIQAEEGFVAGEIND